MSRYNIDSFKLYMEDIEKIPLISRKEEIELAARIRRGDEKAREKLIISNLRLVVKIAHDFKGIGLPLADLVSEGNIGVMRAAEKFDPAKGAKFSSYASWWIKQRMRRALSNQSRDVRIPVQSGRIISKIRGIESQFRSEHNREPSDDEVANLLSSLGKEDYTANTVKSLRLYKNAVSQISLQAPIQQGEDGTFQNLIPDEKQSTGYDSQDLALQDLDDTGYRMREILQSDLLSDREKLIISKRLPLDYTIKETLEEVSQSIGRTRERVRQIQNIALNKMRRVMEMPELSVEEAVKVVKKTRGNRRKEEVAPRKSTTSDLETKVFSQTKFQELNWIPYINLPNLTSDGLRLVYQMNLASGIDHLDLARRLGWNEEKVKSVKIDVDEKTDEFYKFKLAFITGNYYNSNDPSQSLLYSVLSCLDDVSEFDEVVDDLVNKKEYRLILRSLYSHNGSSSTIEELAETTGKSLEDLEYEQYEANNYLASQVGVDPFAMANVKKAPYELDENLNNDERKLMKTINNSEEDLSVEEIRLKMNWDLERMLRCRRSVFNKLVENYLS